MYIVVWSCFRVHVHLYIVYMSYYIIVTMYSWICCLFVAAPPPTRAPAQSTTNLSLLSSQVPLCSVLSVLCITFNSHAWRRYNGTVIGLSVRLLVAAVVVRIYSIYSIDSIYPCKIISFYIFDVPSLLSPAWDDAQIFSFVIICDLISLWFVNNLVVVPAPPCHNQREILTCFCLYSLYM